MSVVELVDREVLVVEDGDVVVLTVGEVGPNSTVPGPPGPVSTTPGPPGPPSTIEGPPGASGITTDVAPTATGDAAAPAQGLSFVINSVVDIVRMVSNFGSGGNDTAAMQKAVNYAAQNGGKLFLRGGVTARHGSLDLSGVREFWGEGRHASKLVASGTLPDYGRLLLIDGNVGMNVRDLEIQLDPMVYGTQVVFDINNTVDVQFDNLNIEGAGTCAVRGAGNSYLTFSKLRINRYIYLGIDVRTCGNHVVVQDCSVFGTGLYHAIAIVNGSFHEIRDCYTEGAKVFGASAYQCSGVKIIGNTFVDGFVEACNVQDTTDFQIIGNACHQRQDGLATDFGMSVYGDAPLGGHSYRGLIANNMVHGCYKSGIALAGNLRQVEVTGNHIYSPNSANEEFGAGVLLYGSGCTQNYVHGNYIIDEVGKMRWGVNEWVGYGDGPPSSNVYGAQCVIGASLGALNTL